MYKHEEARAYAAAAEAEFDGTCCCAGSSRPVHVHFVKGLYDVHRTGVLYTGTNTTTF